MATMANGRVSPEWQIMAESDEMGHDDLSE